MGATKLLTAAGGGITLDAASTATDKTLTIPADNGTLVYANSSGNVGIGTSSPTRLLTLSGSGVNTRVQVNNTVSGKNFGLYAQDDGNSTINYGSSAALLFSESGTERARIDSSGNLLVGTTSLNPSQGFAFDRNTNSYQMIGHANGTVSGSWYIAFNYNSSQIGTIAQNGTTAVSYNTTSDYRLKENVQPMTDALSVVQALKPCTYTWKADGSAGEGFIAHELAEVCPHAVTGEKDAVDADGNPVYQGIDTSFLVATLTAAIQELKAELDAARADIAALKGTQ